MHVEKITINYHLITERERELVGCARHVALLAAELAAGRKLRSTAPAARSEGAQDAQQTANLETTARETREAAPSEKQDPSSNAPT